MVAYGKCKSGLAPVTLLSRLLYYPLQILPLGAVLSPVLVYVLCAASARVPSGACIYEVRTNQGIKVSRNES